MIAEETAALTDSRFLSLPEGWKLRKVGDSFDIQQGKQVSAKTRAGNHVCPFLRTANVFWGRLYLTTLDRMHFSDDEVQRLTLLPNDLLVCEGGDVGRTALWSSETNGVYYQNHLHRLRKKIDGETEPQFFMYWMM